MRRSGCARARALTSIVAGVTRIWAANLRSRGRARVACRQLAARRAREATVQARTSSRAFVVGGSSSDSRTPVARRERRPVCGVGPTVKGIDVSYYQGTIDWTAGAGRRRGVRVHPRLGWPHFPTGLRDVLVRLARGRHRPRRVPVLRPGRTRSRRPTCCCRRWGTFQPDDLPPVIDVEVADGRRRDPARDQREAWVDHVQAAIGRAADHLHRAYFWDDNVGGANMTSSPLWHAQYTSATCPTIADRGRRGPSGSTRRPARSPASRRGGVDVDLLERRRRASLQAFLGRPDAAVRHGRSDRRLRSTTVTRASRRRPAAYCATSTGAGYGQQPRLDAHDRRRRRGELRDVGPHFAEAGTYKVEVFTAAPYAQSKQADYVVHAPRRDDAVTIDQTAVDGWQTLGDVRVRGGRPPVRAPRRQHRRARADNVQLVFDAVRITPVSYPGSGATTGGGGSHGGGGSGDGDGNVGGGCAVGGGDGGATWLCLLGIGLVVSRKAWRALRDCATSCDASRGPRDREELVLAPALRWVSRHERSAQDAVGVGLPRTSRPSRRSWCRVPRSR